MQSTNLSTLKDDMIAFIVGHGMRHFPAVIPEETARVWWNDPVTEDDGANEGVESWKDFVEMAKAVGASMVCLGEDILDAAMLEVLVAEYQELPTSESPGSHLEKLDMIARHVGEVGHIELAFAHQGILFIHESATDWYNQYRAMVDMIDGLHELIEDTLRDDIDEDSV